jgi:RNA polymerase sigma-70 factor (ECF subfamily)
MRHDLLEKLLDRLSSGDAEAAAEVFTAYAPYLRKVIRRRLPPQLRPKLDSVDVLQSAWRDVVEGLRKNNWHFSSPSQLHMFLVRVMRNRCIDRWRQYRRALESEQPLRDVLPETLLARSGPRPDEVAQADDLWQQMVRLCPPEYREVLHLKRGGADAEEIARMTGLHAGSVRRILRQLAIRLASAEPAEGPAPAPR